MKRKFKVMCNSEASDNRYEKLRTKEVMDSDGWLTDYTMYYDHLTEQYVFVFGDNDIYDPETADHDYECEDKESAYEWFENYSSTYEDEDTESDAPGEVDEDEYISKLAHMIQKELNNKKVPAIVEPGDASKEEAIHIVIPDNPSWHVSIPESKLCYITVEDCDYAVEYVVNKMNKRNAASDDELSEANLKKLCVEEGASEKDAADAARILYTWYTAEGVTKMPPLFDILDMCDAADDLDEANIVLRAIGYADDDEM